MRFLPVLLAVFLLAGPALAAGPTADPALSDAANTAFLAANAKKPGVIVKPDGLQFKILQSGYGRRPAATDTVQMYYTGALINGHVFDGTSPGLPAFFKVNEVIPGWVEVLQLMREGDHWQVVIPPSIGYGAKGAGDAIPPNQVLVFDMTLVKATPAPKRGEPGYIPDPNDPEDKQDR